MTTVDGCKYHTTLAPNFFRGETTGIFRIENLENFSSSGATDFAPGSRNKQYLNLQSKIQNLTSPAGGDNYTDLYISTDYAGVKLNVYMTPTGKNLYIGGGGGITLGCDKTGFPSLNDTLSGRLLKAVPPAYQNASVF